MASFNKVIIMGNLTRDPEVRYIPSGTAVTDLGIAVNERYKDRDANEWKEKSVFVDVTVWGRSAENCAEYLSKGSPVLIEGRLQLDQWENTEGQKRSKLKVVADRVQFLSTRKGSSDSQYSSPQQQSPQQQQQPQNEPAVSDDDNLPF